MYEDKKNVNNPVTKMRERFYEIKKQNKICSQKIKETFIKEKSDSEKKMKEKLQNHICQRQTSDAGKSRKSQTKLMKNTLREIRLSCVKDKCLFKEPNR